MHEIPISIGNGAFHDWKASDEEFTFWQTLERTGQNALLRQSEQSCFLCALDRQMAQG